MDGVERTLQRERTRRVWAYVLVGYACVGFLSAASRPLRGHLVDLFLVVPVLVPRAAGVALVFASCVLLLAARGLRRGSRLAWVVSLALLTVAIGLNLAKGLHVFTAIVFAAGAVWLAASPRSFPVLPSRAAVVRASFTGVIGLVAAVVVSVVLVLRIDRVRHQDFDEGVDTVADHLGGHHRLPVDFGGHFALPALVAIGIGVLAVALWVLLSPRVASPLAGATHQVERERARKVVDRFGGGTLDYFALRDDKQWFFVGQSVVAHTVRGGVCLVSPDPIGPAEEREQTWAEFVMYAERSGWSVTVLAASKEWLAIYEATGLRGVYLGDEAVVDCPSFSLGGKKMKSLRHAHGRIQRDGYTVAFDDPAALDEVTRGELAELSTQSRRGEAERGFSMTLSRLFDPDDTGLMLTVARNAEGRPDAFIQWTPAADIDGWSLDVMRRRTDVDLPNGLMDFLIVETISYVAERGGRGLGLNFAMFRSVVSGEKQTPLARASQSVLRRVSRRAQIESLWRFNAKYFPAWAPRYAVVGSFDVWASQTFVMAGAEGAAEVPIFGRFLNRGRS